MAKPKLSKAVQNQDRDTVHEALQDVRAFRLSLEETQAEFWSRFGVSQTAGSRYETEGDTPNKRTWPPSVAMLIALYATGYVTDDDLAEIRDHIEGFFVGTIGGPRALVRPTMRDSARQRAVDRLVRERESKGLSRSSLKKT